MKKLFKSSTDKKLCGVCGGFAQYLNIDPTVLRVIWGVSILFASLGFWAYIICALVMPYDTDIGA